MGIAALRPVPFRGIALTGDSSLRLRRRTAYSWRSASTGSRLAALLAGYSPKKIPMAAENSVASKMEPMPMIGTSGVPARAAMMPTAEESSHPKPIPNTRRSGSAWRIRFRTALDIRLRAPRLAQANFLGALIYRYEHDIHNGHSAYHNDMRQLPAKEDREHVGDGVAMERKSSCLVMVKSFTWRGLRRCEARIIVFVSAIAASMLSLLRA